MGWSDTSTADVRTAGARSPSTGVRSAPGGCSTAFAVRRHPVDWRCCRDDQVALGEAAGSRDVGSIGQIVAIDDLRPAIIEPTDAVLIAELASLAEGGRPPERG